MRFIRHNIPLTIFVVIAISLGLYLWLTPWVSTSIGPFYGPKAATNPYLAAEMFLNEYGVQIEKHGDASRLDFALAASDVLLMTNQNGDFSQDQIQNLFDWIDAGGTLIYQPTTLYGEEGDYSDQVLAHESLRLAVNPSRIQTHTPSPDVHHADVTCQESNRATSVTLRDRQYQIGMSRDVMLRSKADDDSTLRPIYGQSNSDGGTLIIITGLRQWRNNLIQCHDNAQFLHDLVVRQPGTKLWLAWLDGAESEPLLRQLWHWFPQSSLTLAVLLLCWLWNRIPREQPITTTIDRRENALEDYLLRKAIFRWRSANSLHQLSNLRAEIQGQTRPSYTQSDYERFSQATGASIEEMKSALHSNEWTGQREMIKFVATLSRIRGVI